MPCYRGNLVTGGDVLAKGIEIWIDVDPGTGRLSSWCGSFDLPEEHTFFFTEHSQCEIVLADGRKGTIIPKHCDGITVDFQGSGPLQ